MDKMSDDGLMSVDTNVSRFFSSGGHVFTSGWLVHRQTRGGRCFTDVFQHDSPRWSLFNLICTNESLEARFGFLSSSVLLSLVAVENKLPADNEL